MEGSQILDCIYAQGKIARPRFNYQNHTIRVNSLVTNPGYEGP